MDADESKYQHVRLSDIAAVGRERRPGIRDWIPIRDELGIRSFGVNAFVAAQAGDRLIERHTEVGEMAGKHEELYLVLTGSAVFDIGGDEVQAQAGMLVLRAGPSYATGCRRRRSRDDRPRRRRERRCALSGLRMGANDDQAVRETQRRRSVNPR